MKTPIEQDPVDVNVSRRRCEYCDDTGDVHDQLGEWRGQCNCGAATDVEERYLREHIAMLQESYAKAAKPYIDRLVAINAMRRPAPMIVTVAQAQALGLMPANGGVQGDAQGSLRGSPGTKC